MASGTRRPRRVSLFRGEVRVSIMRLQIATMVAVLGLSAGPLRAQILRLENATSAISRLSVGEEVRIAMNATRLTGALALLRTDSIVVREARGDLAVPVASIDTIWKASHRATEYAGKGAKIGAVGLGLTTLYVLGGLGGRDEGLITGTVLGTGIGASLGAMIGGAIGVNRLQWSVVFRR